MLRNDFYTITSVNRETNATNATLTINGAHKIFEGHFPGQPVVPGVCMMLMVNEITAMALGKDLQLIKADELKFLHIINPIENKEIRIHVSYNSASATAVNVSATLFRDNIACFKFKGSYKIQDRQ